MDEEALLVDEGGMFGVFEKGEDEFWIPPVIALTLSKNCNLELDSMPSILMANVLAELFWMFGF